MLLIYVIFLLNFKEKKKRDTASFAPLAHSRLHRAMALNIGPVAPGDSSKRTKICWPLILALRLKRPLTKNGVDRRREH